MCMCGTLGGGDECMCCGWCVLYVQYVCKGVFLIMLLKLSE